MGLITVVICGFSHRLASRLSHSARREERAKLVAAKTVFFLTLGVKVGNNLMYPASTDLLENGRDSHGTPTDLTKTLQSNTHLHTSS